MTPKEKAISNLVDNIKKCNQYYREGKAIVPDKEYDAMIADLKKLDPDNEILKKAIIEEVDKSNPRMEKLPIPMFSLEKFTDVAELKKFIQNTWQPKPTDRIVITPKYDGISLCVNEDDVQGWTRGDGTEGQRSDDHLKAMGVGSIDEPHFFNYTFGEAIFPIQAWAKVKGEYKSPRNCIAGLFNSPIPANILHHAHYVRYGTDRQDINKEDQLNALVLMGIKTSFHWMVTASNFNNNEKVIEEMLSNMFEKCDKYRCDGLVIEVNDATRRIELGRLPNNNPRYAVAYKNPEWAERAETKVKGIEWNVSKDGKVKPVLLIEPVDLCDATVSRATAYNAKYVVDNFLCEGSVIVICRSGDVIPKHLKTLSHPANSFISMMDDMIICPSCGEPLVWDNTHTDLICPNEVCPQKKVAEMVYFFSTLEVEEFGEPTIQRFYDAGYDSINSILTITKEQIKAIDGCGQALANKLVSQFTSLKDKGVPLAKMLTAYNVFGGVLAEKTCQMIINNLSDEDLNRLEIYEEIPEDHLLTINGVGLATARAFNAGVQEYGSLQDEGILISYMTTPNKKVAENQMNVCFTGFRNKEWESRLIEAGHKIASGVTSKTTHLVVKDASSGSSKKVKANSLQIPIYTAEEFLKFMEENDI